MTKNMTKAQMAEMIAQLSTEIEALKAEKESTPVVPASTKQTATKGKTKTSAKTSTKSAPKESAPVLPVRKGKTVSFDGYVNYKVWVHNKPLMSELKGEYDRESKTISFPSAKAAEAFCKGFVPVLTSAQYEESKKAIDDGFKARKAEREKAASSEATKTPKESAAKKSGLIAKSAKAKKGADSSEPVKKPEWRERAEKGEKPFANYSTYKEYWHAVIGK